MAIMAIFVGKGIKKEQYEALRKEVNWEKNQPAGVIFHAASFDPSGDARVVDLWESPEELNQFVEGRLVPAMQKAKLAPPSVEVFPVHNVNAYKAIEKFKL